MTEEEEEEEENQIFIAIEHTLLLRKKKGSSIMGGMSSREYKMMAVCCERYPTQKSKYEKWPNYRLANLQIDGKENLKHKLLQ